MQNIKEKNSGRTLVEVMIAMTIGLAILLAVTSLFIANRQTFRTGDDKSRMEEEGRIAINLLAFHIRMAGYGSLRNANNTETKDIPDPETSGGVLTNRVLPSICTNFSQECNTANAIRGCAGKLTEAGVALPNATTALGCTVDTSHTLIVRYVADVDNANQSDAKPTDCLGTALILSPTGAFIAENRFFVQLNNNGVPELYCQGNGNTATGANLAVAAQPIAENVEQIQFRYGLASNDREQSATQFVSAGDIEASPSLWDRVVAVRVCLLVRSANDNVTDTKQTYTNCQNESVTATDKRLRSVFTTTVTLRSRATGAI